MLSLSFLVLQSGKKGSKEDKCRSGLRTAPVNQNTYSVPNAIKPLPQRFVKPYSLLRSPAASSSPLSGALCRPLLLPPSSSPKVLLKLLARPRNPLLVLAPSPSSSSLAADEAGSSCVRACASGGPSRPRSSSSSSSCDTNRLARRLGRLRRVWTLRTSGLDRAKGQPPQLESV